MAKPTDLVQGMSIAMGWLLLLPAFSSPPPNPTRGKSPVDILQVRR